ncbi:MAG TPA: FAD-dependent oxidoreductase [Gaiellaceae bacterium]|nr:FAD-dependent oxidoreductase [Gaiellaceae bacterium]
MSLPVLIVVEEEPGALADVAAQLLQRYGRDYRVEPFGSADDASHALTELADARAEVALALVGASLVATTDGGLLDRVRRLHPQAKRALLIPFADWGTAATNEAIGDLMALGRIDHYVLTPAGAPDEVFHAAVSSFLLEWARERRSVPHTVHIVGSEWAGRAYELRTVFEQCAVPHAFWLADSDKGRELIARAGPDAALPLMALPDGRVLCDPSDAEIAEAAGAPSELEADAFDVVIVGAGPAGLSAAVYAASEGLRTLVVDEGGIGGQARASSLIRNYLGFAKGVSGSRLAEQAYEQAIGFGARFLFLHRATSLAQVRQGFELALSNGRRVGARAVILATGASYRRLDVPSLDALTGAGVFYGGPAAEAAGLHGKDVYVAGGGNSAGQAALHLARHARRVTLLVRGSRLDAGMSHYLVRAVEAAPNIEVRTEATVAGGGGDGRLERLVLRDAAGGDEATVAADALFVLIGARPHTDWLPPELARDELGFVLTGDELSGDVDWPLERRPLALETSMPGVLAAGDLRRASVKRVASAVGEGSIAAQLVHAILAEDRQEALR